MKEQGVASAIVSTGQQIGGAIGLAVIMAIISANMGASATLETLKPTELNGAIHSAFIIAAAIALLGILIAFIALKQKKSASLDTNVEPIH